MARWTDLWRSFYRVVILLLLSGCVPLRPTPSPSPVPPPPPPPPPAVRIHARAGIDGLPPPPSAGETASFLIASLPIAEAQLSPPERRLYLAADTGVPIYEMRGFPLPERRIPERSFYLVLPEETRQALVAENPSASEDEVLSAFRKADNEWVVLTVRAINGLFDGAYARPIRDNALLIPTFDKDGKKILIVMQPNDGCSERLGICDANLTDNFTNRVQIFWFEDGDLRRVVVGFPEIYDWYTNEKFHFTNPMRYNPKDGQIYQLSRDERFLQFSLFQDEEGKWRWKILPELTPYLADRREETLVEMAALGERTGFFGQGVWQEVERSQKSGVETVVYRVHEGEDANNEDDVGYLVVETKKDGEVFYFLIITKSQKVGRGANPAAITTEKGQSNLVEAYRRLVINLPPSLLEIVYRYGNMAGIFIEDETYEQRRQKFGYDFPRENPGATGWGPVVLYRQFPETPQEDFLTRPQEDLIATIVIEAMESRGIDHHMTVASMVEDERDLRNATQEEYKAVWATINGRRDIRAVVVPSEKAFSIVFDKNPMVNTLIQLLVYLMSTKGDGVYFPNPRFWWDLWEASKSALGYYLSLFGTHPPSFGVASSP